MDGNLYERVYRLLASLDHPAPPGVTHADRTIALFLYRAAADGLSHRQVVQRGHWVGLTEPASWPSQPTLSRRADSPGVRAVLAALEQRLRSLDPPPPHDRPTVAAVDGRAFDVGRHTTDPEATRGWGTGRIECGYKATVLWAGGCLPLAWAVEPMNTAECVVARRLFPALPPTDQPAFILGDAGYDATALYALAAERGWQLLAPPKKAGRRLGHRPHHPARLAGRTLLDTPVGQGMYRQRSAIERQFAAWATRPEGLNELPKHVRRLHRVRRHVTLSLHLNAVRILMNLNAFHTPTHE